MSNEDAHSRNNTFLARYGAIILRGGIAAIPAALYRYQAELKLSPQQVWFISAILAHKWDADMPYPSLKRMAEQVGVSEQHLHNLKRQLTTNGWLLIINRRNDRGGQETNYYDFTPLFGRLEQLLQRDREPSDQQAGGLNHSLARGLNGSLAGGLNTPSALIEPVDQKQETGPSNFRMAVAEEAEAAEQASQPNTTGQRSNPRKPPDQGSLQEGDPRPAVHGKPGRAGFQRVSAVLERKRTRASPTVPDPNRQVIVDYLSDLAREFSDRADLRVTIARVMNDFTAAGVPLETFIGSLYEARSQTKASYASLRDRGKKMAYFLSCLETLLGLRELPQSPEEHRSRKQKEQATKQSSAAPAPNAKQQWIQTYRRSEGLPRVGGGDE